MTQSIDVDAILANLPAELDDPGIDPWGGASLLDGAEESL